jgi:hypothetical protein
MSMNQPKDYREVLQGLHALSDYVAQVWESRKETSLHDVIDDACGSHDWTMSPRLALAVTAILRDQDPELYAAGEQYWIDSGSPGGYLGRIACAYVHGALAEWCWIQVQEREIQY